ncbi:MAG: cation transporter [Porphyromonadaceae bacterium]|nr:cation transporter [Porphyromonadaceae bacterium]
MYKSVFHISGMDCPCEERLIRMKLEGHSAIKRLEFDLERRLLSVFHTDAESSFEAELYALDLGAKLLERTKLEQYAESLDHHAREQRRVLWIVLAINLFLFLVEMAFGLVSDSMGLVADSLDMLADALVYGMSLMAVGASILRKKRVALLSGYLQMGLAMLGLIEVFRRFLGLEVMPEFESMIGISLLALLGNASCLWLLQRTQDQEAHIRASVIFSANDVVVNIGVIVAGLLVWWWQSNIPDLLIGLVVFVVVIRGAVRILRLAR